MKRETEIEISALFDAFLKPKADEGEKAMQERYLYLCGCMKGFETAAGIDPKALSRLLGTERV